MKKLLITMVVIAAAVALRAQDAPTCACPPMKLYVYDTKIDFTLDSSGTAAEVGKYVEAQNSGGKLEGDYLAQQTDDFKVYANIAPGAKTGSTYQLPPADGSGPPDIDFTSYAEVSRSGSPGSYVYNVAVTITDAHNGSIVSRNSIPTSDLGLVDDRIDAITGSYSPMEDKLRTYEKHLRDNSGGSEWIGLKWQTIPDKLTLKIQEKTKVKIKLFDCPDQKPADSQKIKVKLTNDDVGSLDKTEVETNSSGEAEVIFTAKKNGYTRVVPDLTFTDIWQKSGKNATSCSDQQDITVADAEYKVKMQAEITGPGGIHYKLEGETTASLISFADSTFGLRPTDGTKNMQIKVDAAGVDGKMTLQTPKNYNIPFVINVGNVGKLLNKPAKAKISIEAFSPTANNGVTLPEVYQTQAYPLTLTGNINQMFSACFMKNTVATVQENGTKARQDMEFIQRVRANENNPAYFQSAQGKADMQALQKLSQENGFDLSKMYSGPGKAPAGTSAASQAFVHGIQATQSNAAGAPNAYTPTVLGGMFHADGTFNPQSATAMEINENSSDTGELHGAIKITVEKIN